MEILRYFNSAKLLKSKESSSLPGDENSFSLFSFRPTVMQILGNDYSLLR